MPDTTEIHRLGLPFEDRCDFRKFVEPVQERVDVRRAYGLCQGKLTRRCKTLVANYHHMIVEPHGTDFGNQAGWKLIPAKAISSKIYPAQIYPGNLGSHRRCKWRHLHLSFP